MRTAGVTVALAVYWLAAVVGAVSLPPDDQYSPQRSPYKRDALRGPRGYPNWLEYHQAPSTELQPPNNKPGITSARLDDLSRESKAPKDSMIRDLDFLSLTPGGWNEATARAMSSSSHRNVPEKSLEILPASREDSFDADDAFQDQGPGSVEVYKLDLHRENSLLVPLTKKNQSPALFRVKSKNPKKAKGDDILWKLKPIEPSKPSLPAVFRDPTSIYREETIPPESMRHIKEVPKEEVFTVGGVPELQVGCEGLEASDRKRRSSGPGEEDSYDEYKPKFGDPVYRESTEPILLRVTPIVLDFEDEPPSGQIYEELDELLKLKSSTTQEPTTKRTNRGDIDPALENYEHEDVPIDEMLPERGDLGSNGSKGNARVQRSIQTEDSRVSKVEGVRFPRKANREESPFTTGISSKDDDTSSPIIGSRDESLNHRGGRKLLSVQYPARDESQARTRRHQGIDENQNPDLWGFGEDDGGISMEEEESDANELRRVEEEKRRREYERRMQEQINREHGGRHPHLQPNPSTDENMHSKTERIRKEHERLREREQRERQRLEEEKRRQEDRRRREDEQRRAEEVKRRQSEESQRRMDEEEKRHRDPLHSRSKEKEEQRRDWIKRREEEERRLRLENERNHQAPPAALTRPSPYNRLENVSSNHQEEERREAEERKLREYIERNRPINVKKNNDRRRPDDQTRRKIEDEERRKHAGAERWRPVDEERRRQQEDQERRRQYEEQQKQHQSTNENERTKQREEQERRREMEEQERRRKMEEQLRRHPAPDEMERRRQYEERERNRQMEEQRRRQQSPYDNERRRPQEEQERKRQMEEQQSRQQSPDENERRRQMQEQIRRDRPDRNREREDEMRRQLEEEKKLQEYVRRNQPVNVSKQNSSRGSDWQEQRRILDEARQWDQHKTQKDGRIRGPSAPTSNGQRRSQENIEEFRRRQEAERLEDERRRFEEEGRKREEEYRRQESRRHEEERQRLVAQRQREEANRRRPNWQDSSRPANTTLRGDNRDPGELRRYESSKGTTSDSRRNQEQDGRRNQELERQRQQQHEERERLRIEQERNDRNNERQRPHHANSRPSEQRQRGESSRNQEEAERRRREEARLNALPVSARIMIHTDQAAYRAPPVPPVISIGSRAGFGNDIDFPAINPNRPGLAAHRFPAPATQKPPAKSPSPCVWAIVNCCPANNRLSTCFESMGCPGINWDPNPCRASIQSAARAQVLSFYDTAEDNYSRV